MVDDRPDTTRRKFIATSAILLGAGCVNRSEAEDDPESNSTTTSTDDPARNETTPTDSPSEPNEEQSPVDDRTTDVEPDVHPSYQGRFLADGEMVDNFEDLELWSVRKGGEIVADAERRFGGTQSLSYDGMGRSVLIGDYRADPIDLSDAALSFAADFRQPTDAQPTFYVIAEAPDNNSQILFGRPYTSKVAGWQRYDVAPLEIQGNPDPSDIRRLKVVVQPPGDGPVSFNLDDFRAHPKPDTGKLIFRFDDCHAVHYDDYFPVLQDHGYPGLQAVNSRVVSVNNSQRLSIQQLHDFQDAGWDLCNHTTGHYDISELSEAELRRDIEAMDDWFDRYDLHQGTDMFVYPYGSYDGKSMDVLADRYDLAFNGGWMTNYSVTNPLAVNSFDAENGIADTKELVDRVARHRSLGVLTFHKQYTREQFAEIVEYVAANDDIDVITGSDLRDHVQSRA